MRLLFDQNLPGRFVKSLADLFPQSLHVGQVGLQQATDREIWRFAGDGGFAIVSKDGDFHHLSFLLGAPPKAIWLRCGNASVEALEGTIREYSDTIERFLHDGEAALLVLGRKD